MICPNCNLREPRAMFYTGEKDLVNDEFFKCPRCKHGFTKNDPTGWSRVRKPKEG